MVLVFIILFHFFQPTEFHLQSKPPRNASAALQKSRNPVEFRVRGISTKKKKKNEEEGEEEGEEEEEEEEEEENDEKEEGE